LPLVCPLSATREQGSPVAHAYIFFNRDVFTYLAQEEEEEEEEEEERTEKKTLMWSTL
jgi:hypothetical protein